MNTKNTHPFSFDEMTAALALIGILALILIFTNNLSDRNYKIAVDRMLTVDNALRAWEQTLIKKNVDISKIFSNQHDLVNSISEYIDKSNNSTIGTIASVSTSDIDGAEALHLSSGIIINVKYINSSNSTPVALITSKAEIIANGKPNILNEEYILKSSSLENLTDTYKGWNKYLIVSLGKGKNGFCLKKGGKCSFEEYEQINAPANTYVYVKNNNQISCADGTANTIIKTKSVATGSSLQIQKVTSKDSGLCKTCPEGTYYDDRIKTCSVCQAGTYNNVKGAIKCIQCDIGTYQDNDGQDKCIACPTNSITYKKGSKSISDCKCKAGFAIKTISEATCPTTIAVTNNFDCKLVGIGAYSPENDNCAYNCPDNASTENNGSKDISQCKCKPGFAIGNGDIDNCTLGLNGSNSCVIVEQGAYSPGPYLNNCYTYCPQNTNTKNTGSTSIVQCLCKAGYATDEKGSPIGNNTTCKVTTPGYYSPEFDNVMHPCECGTYQNEYGKASCKNVPPGYYPINNNSLAQTKADSVIICPNGHACPGNCDPPIKCLAGTFAADRTKAGVTEGAVRCADCPAGNYCQYDSMANPLPCECGKYQDEMGQKKCKDCKSNQFAPKNSTKCYDVDKYSYIAPDNKCYPSSCPELNGTDDYNRHFSAKLIAKKNACECDKYEFAYKSDYDAPNYTVMLSSKGHNCPATVISTDPVILDLKNNGIVITDRNKGVEFDLDVNGVKELTAWTNIQTEFDDAFVCIDNNNNGKIDDGSELLNNKISSDNNFNELKNFDDNNDGKIDSKDSIYNKLLLWVDFNKNGVADIGELKTLLDASVNNISTTYHSNFKKNKNTPASISANNDNSSDNPLTKAVNFIKKILKKIINKIFH